MNVVIYARYSSYNQTEQSIEGQIAVCTEYAKKNNYTIVGEFIDRALTGTNDNRPQFRKMIEESNKKYFQGVLVYQLDRFARNRYDSAINKNILKKNGVRVFSAKENIAEDASGILMESVLEGMAEYYSAELSQKVKRGMQINAEKCLCNGGKTPLGYKIENKKYIINEEEAGIVKKIFEMYNNGHIMTDIVTYMNERNIKTSYGNKFNKSSIRKILLNKKYIGIYTYGDIEVKNGIPRIIDDKTFNEVQKKMLKNKQAPARNKAKTEYLLTTKLFCGNCKEMMTGTSGTSSTKRMHYYYTCNGRKKHICNRKNIQKELIEDIVVEQARNMLTDKDIEKISNEVVKVAEKEKNSNNLKILEKALKENERQKTNLLESLKICEIDSVRKSIFEELEKMEEEHKRIENNILLEKSSHLDITVTEVKYFLTKMREGDVNDIRYRKLLINVLINKVYVYDDNLTIIFNIQDKKNSIIKAPSIEKIERSFLDENGSPNLKNLKLLTLK